MSHTTHIPPAIEPGDLNRRLDDLRVEIERLLAEGHSVAVTVANERDELTPQQAADRLGFSRQHVRRLVDAGEIEASQLPDSLHWRIPLRAVLAFEERRAAAMQHFDERSRELDRLGAPRE